MAHATSHQSHTRPSPTWGFHARRSPDGPLASTPTPLPTSWDKRRPPGRATCSPRDASSPTQGVPHLLPPHLRSRPRRRRGSPRSPRDRGLAVLAAGRLGPAGTPPLRGGTAPARGTVCPGTASADPTRDAYVSIPRGHAQGRLPPEVAPAVPSRPHLIPSIPPPIPKYPHVPSGDLSLFHGKYRPLTERIWSRGAIKRFPPVRD